MASQFVGHRVESKELTAWGQLTKCGRALQGGAALRPIQRTTTVA